MTGKFVRGTSAAWARGVAHAQRSGANGRRMPVRTPRHLFFLAFLFALASAAPAAASDVYVTNQTSDNVSQYDVGAGGAPRAKSPPTVPAATPRRGRGEPRRAERLRRRTESDNVSQYDVGAGGALAPKSPPTVPAGDRPTGSR